MPDRLIFVTTMVELDILTPGHTHAVRRPAPVHRAYRRPTTATAPCGHRGALLSRSQEQGCAFRSRLTGKIILSGVTCNHNIDIVVLHTKQYMMHVRICPILASSEVDAACVRAGDSPQAFPRKLSAVMDSSTGTIETVLAWATSFRRVDIRCVDMRRHHDT